MEYSALRFLYLFSLLIVTDCVYGNYRGKITMPDTVSYISPFAKENERCLKCHGQARYEYTNETLGRHVKAMMCSERIIDRKLFYNSNHKSFSCVDCHSSEYATFPHPGELRMKLCYNCIDCHGSDEKFSPFGFEKIGEEFQKSIHYKLEEYGFSCWKCHNPHTYRINIRNTENLKETILYDNNICLNCHSDYNRFQLLSSREEMNIIEKHDWLPDQALHFSSVRCIECHTKIIDSLLVSHFIVPKDQAVKKCNECHSRNSILMASLYKYQSKEQLRGGFFNGIILNESFVIGANRNKYLNILSLVIFGLVILIIGIHIYFRVIKK